MDDELDGGVGDLLGAFITSEILARDGGGGVTDRRSGVSICIRSSSRPGDAAEDAGDLVVNGGNTVPEPTGAIPEPTGRGCGGRTGGRSGLPGR